MSQKAFLEYIWVQAIISPLHALDVGLEVSMDTSLLVALKKAWQGLDLFANPNVWLRNQRMSL